MAEEIGFENGRNSNFQGLVTLTLTLDPAIRHTVVHHSSTYTYIPNFIQIEETFCGRTDGRTDVRTDGHFPPYIIRSTFGSRPNNLRRCLFSWRQASNCHTEHHRLQYTTQLWRTERLTSQDRCECAVSRWILKHLYNHCMQPSQRQLHHATDT